MRGLKKFKVFYFLVGDTIVKCENHDKCKTIYNHLKKENKK